MFVKNGWIYLANWNFSEERRRRGRPLLLVGVPQAVAFLPFLHVHLSDLLNILRRRRWKEVFIDDGDLRNGRLPRLKKEILRNCLIQLL